MPGCSRSEPPQGLGVPLPAPAEPDPDPARPSLEFGPLVPPIDARRLFTFLARATGACVVALTSKPAAFLKPTTPESLLGGGVALAAPPRFNDVEESAVAPRWPMSTVTLTGPPGATAGCAGTAIAGNSTLLDCGNTATVTAATATAARAEHPAQSAKLRVMDFL
jgi:hypothetical protein